MAEKEIIERAWDNGIVHVGTVTFDSARYVADYVQKKWSGPKAQEEYGTREPPFQVQSLGIGKKYALANAEQISEQLGITVRGVQVGIPRYYKKLLAERIDSERIIEHSLEANQAVIDHHESKAGRDAEAVWASLLASRLQADRNLKAKAALKKKKL